MRRSVRDKSSSTAHCTCAAWHSTVSSLPACMAPARGSLNTITCATKEEHLVGAARAVKSLG